MRKRYHEILRGAIKDSGLSLSEIAEGLIMYGFHIDKSYISKLQNGKTGPASDALNRCLAAVLNIDAEKLLDAAFYEKAPEELKETLDQIRALREIKNNLNHAENELSNAVTGYEESLKVIEAAKQELYSLEAQELLEKTGHPVDEFIRVPMIGTIPAGSPVLASEHIIEWKLIPNPGHYREGELFTLTVKGDSMIGSRIYDGDIVLVRVQPAVEDGEIAVVNVDGDNATLKRVKRVNGSYVLLPDNPKYDPIIVKSHEARICGKVIQVIFDPHRKS